MGRTYAVSLGCLALVSCIVHGWLCANLPEDILVRGIAMLFVFAGIGWVIGQAAEQIVRQSLEMNYRTRIEQLRQTQSGANVDSKVSR